MVSSAVSTLNVSAYVRFASINGRRNKRVIDKNLRNVSIMPFLFSVGAKTKTEVTGEK